jgi:formylglycine-generating enzyme required for sulfatase activity
MKRFFAALALSLGSLGTLCPLVAEAADYVALPGGRFESVLPQGPVATVRAPVSVAAFALRSAPVTQREFAAFVQQHPEWQRGQAPALFADKRYLVDWPSPTQAPAATADSPAVNVSWFAAKAFCESEDARLPTWLEWEYAAAADETRRDARDDPAWRQRILAWYERPTGASLPHTGGPANAYGVRDLHGLVWEWVDDFNALFIAGDSRTQGDPDLLKFCGSGALNVLDRDSYAVLMRIALLSSLNAADTTANLGFRCAKPLATSSP